MRRLRNALRRRLDFVPAQQRPRHGLIGAVVLAVAALALFSAVTHNIPLLRGEPGRVVRAEFASANQVSARTPVRVAGVEVGKVDEVGPGRAPGTAIVTMRITNDDIVLKRDAQADIRWRTLLGGNMYIDIRPGSSSAPALDGEVIPVDRTSSQVELDDVNQVFDGQTAEAERTLLREFRRGFADPESAGAAIEALGPSLRTVGRGVEPLRGTESDDLRRLVAATAQTVEGLGRDSAALRDLVAGGRRTLAVTNARRSELGELIELTPPSLDSTLTTMVRLRTTLDHLDPLVARLRPGARALAPATLAAAPTLDQAEALLREARPILRDAGPALDALRRASLTGVPLLRALDPTVRRLDGELLPFLARRDPATRLRNYEAIGPAFSAVGGSAAEFNDLGFVIQFPAPGGPNSALTASGAPPGSSAGSRLLVRQCERNASTAERGRCAAAARLVARIFGGTP